MKKMMMKKTYSIWKRVKEWNQNEEEGRGRRKKEEEKGRSSE